MTKPIHKHLLIRAEVKNPPKENDERRLVNWMRYLIQDIDMKLLFGPITRYVDVEGNEGLTAIAMIETSHIAIHVWDEVIPALVQCDVYSCAEFSSNEVLAEFVDMEPTKIEFSHDPGKYEYVVSFKDKSRKMYGFSSRYSQLPSSTVASES